VFDAAAHVHDLIADSAGLWARWGAEVGAEDVEFFVVADDALVDRDGVFEAAVFDVGAEFAEDVESLGDGRGWPVPSM